MPDRDTLRDHLAALSYPITRADAAAELAEVEIRVDGEPVTLGRVVSEVGSDAFDDAEALAAEVEAALGAAEEKGDGGAADE